MRAALDGSMVGVPRIGNEDSHTLDDRCENDVLVVA